MTTELEKLCTENEREQERGRTHWSLRFHHQQTPNKKTPIGSPTGTIFNGSVSDFLLAPKTPVAFLFCAIDGTIAAWNPNVGVA
jgi:hypothetical protein